MTRGSRPGAEPDRLYRLLVEAVRDYAIFALDATGHVRTWNAGAQRFKGYTADEIIGRHFSTFYPPEDVAARKPEIELEIAAREGVVEDEGWRVRKDGTRFWALVVITALRDETGALVGFAKVTRDLTERRAAEERAVDDARRVADAEATSRAKSEFLAAMSHELRTPLNATLGYVELLEMGLRGPVTDEQRADLARIRRSQQHLLGIINDILNYSRMAAGTISFVAEPLALASITDSVLPMLEPQFRSKGLTLDQGDCDADAVAYADRAKVEQILVNLLSNASKFTPEGGRVTVGCEIRGDCAQLWVSDTGPGVPEDKRDAIFEPFVQLGRSLTTAQEGTGLGLAISRELARAMGGDLCYSEGGMGGGATFVLELPLEQRAAS